MISDNKKIENYIKVQLEILEELLKRHASDLDIKTNFFDLGLSSISALDFIELVNKRLKINLSPEVIYEVDSIKSLALHINELYNMDKSQDTDKIEPYEDISIQTDQTHTQTYDFI